MAAWIKMPLGMEVGLGPSDFLLDGDPAPFPKKGAPPSPQFSAHFYYRQTAGCIKMPLGMEVGLNPGDFVLDGYPDPLNFRPIFIIHRQSKKGATLTMAITLSILDRFAKIFSLLQRAVNFQQNQY